MIPLEDCLVVLMAMLIPNHLVFGCFVLFTMHLVVCYIGKLNLLCFYSFCISFVSRSSSLTFAYYSNLVWMIYLNRLYPIKTILIKTNSIPKDHSFPILSHLPKILPIYFGTVAKNDGVGFGFGQFLIVYIV